MALPWLPGLRLPRRQRGAQFLDKRRIEGRNRRRQRFVVDLHAIRPRRQRDDLRNMCRAFHRIRQKALHHGGVVRCRFKWSFVSKI